MVIKGIFGYFIQFLSYNFRVPVKAIYKLGVKPFVNHLFALVVHLPDRVDVRKQAVNAIAFKVAHLALKFLDL